jgi:heme/copper-type cytochrome/quinol oxidase subunit 4
MTLNLALPLVALPLNLALIAIALARGHRRPVDWLFAEFALSMALWNVGVFRLRAATTADEAGVAEVVVLGVVALPAVYLHFVLAFLDATDGSGQRWLRASYAAAAVFAALNLSESPWLMRGVWARVPGPLYPPSWCSSTRS